MAQYQVYTADRIFTGEEWLQDHAIIVEGSLITSIVPKSEVSSETKPRDFGKKVLAPAFIDLQIYGAYGKLFAVYPDVTSLEKLVSYCREGGASFCMPTVATNEYEVFYKSIDAIKAYWKNGKEGVLGLHIEGPWINSVKRGAHIESLIHPPEINQVKQLLEYGKDVIKIITLAPEVCSQEVLKLILSYNIVISAGHSNATYDEAMGSFSSGITAATHLYNAMSPLQHRQPGLVGACFNHGKVMASIIPDGFHVDFAAIKIAKEIMKERLFVITDAVTETNEGYYPHQLEGKRYVSEGILSGSALKMGTAYFNLVNETGISKEESIRMCSLYPARVIGREKDLGMISKGYNAQFALIDQDKNSVSLIG